MIEKIVCFVFLEYRYTPFSVLLSSVGSFRSEWRLFVSVSHAALFRLAVLTEVVVVVVVVAAKEGHSVAIICCMVASISMKDGRCE